MGPPFILLFMGAREIRLVSMRQAMVAILEGWRMAAVVTIHVRRQLSTRE